MTAPSLSVIIPTIARPSLAATLDSIAAAGIGLDDQVLMVSDSPVQVTEESHDLNMAAARSLARHTNVLAVLPGRRLGGWGGPGRNIGIQEATGTHLVFIDDDDVYLPGALQVIREIIATDPQALHVWRMVARGGHTLWTERDVRVGNIGTPMFAVPRGCAGQWTTRYEGDFDFFEDSLIRAGGQVRWHEDVLVRCG
jgi:glycosyltransferase involved in cell wall biosynthesis